MLRLRCSDNDDDAISPPPRALMWEGMLILMRALLLVEGIVRDAIMVLGLSADYDYCGALLGSDEGKLGYGTGRRAETAGLNKSCEMFRHFFYVRNASLRSNRGNSEERSELHAPRTTNRIIQTAAQASEVNTLTYYHHEQQ